MVSRRTKSWNEHLQAKGELAFEATPQVARVLLAISNAFGTLVSQDDDPAALRAIVIPIWEHFLRSLKAPDQPSSARATGRLIGSVDGAQ